jgi:hypothetical protein
MRCTAGVFFILLSLGSAAAQSPQYRRPAPAQEDCPQGRQIRQQQGFYPSTMTDCQVLDADTAVENQKLQRKPAPAVASKPPKPVPAAGASAGPPRPAAQQTAAPPVPAAPPKPPETVAATPDTPVAALTTVGTLYTTPGMPVCDTPEHLKEYLLAAVNRDQQWARELGEDCPTVKGGLKAVIIEDLPSDSDVLHVIKIRVFSPYGKGSATGYAVNVGLTESPTGAIAR